MVPQHGSVSPVLAAVFRDLPIDLGQHREKAESSARGRAAH